MQVKVDHREFIVNAASEYMFSIDDYTTETAKKLIEIMCKNFGVFSIDDEQPFISLIREVWSEAVIKKGNDEGYNGVDFMQGIVGFDGCGRSIRNHTIAFSNDKKLAAKSFDAGRAFAIERNL